ALDAVVSAFTRGASSDEAFFAADADGATLAAQVRTQARHLPEQAGLSEAGTRLYHLVLDECCDIYVQTVIHLQAFAPRASAVALARLASQGEQLTEVLARLPVRSLDAPAGTGDDEQFRHRYLTH